MIVFGLFPNRREQSLGVMSEPSLVMDRGRATVMMPSISILFYVPLLEHSGTTKSSTASLAVLELVTEKRSD